MRVRHLILILFSCYSLANSFATANSGAEDEIERESEHEEREKQLSQDGNGLCTFEITYGKRLKFLLFFFWTKLIVKLLFQEI